MSHTYSWLVFAACQFHFWCDIKDQQYWMHGRNARSRQEGRSNWKRFNTRKKKVVRVLKASAKPWVCIVCLLNDQLAPVSSPCKYVCKSFALVKPVIPLCRYCGYLRGAHLRKLRRIVTWADSSGGSSLLLQVETSIRRVWVRGYISTLLFIRRKEDFWTFSCFVFQWAYNLAATPSCYRHQTNFSTC